jgi:thiol-disulfide isomerase/thioredoxin
MGLRALVLVVVLLVATAAGLIWRARNGRVRAKEDKIVQNDIWGELGIHPADAEVTLVQFSSAFCAPCRVTRRVLADVAAQLPAIKHVEVDAESHLDAVRALDVRSTPTTLLVDPSGRIAGRAVGAPRKTEVLAALGPLLESPPTR